MFDQPQNQSVVEIQHAIGTPALKNLREQAEAGDPCAQFRLGVIYEEGRGVAPSGRQAERWYRRAALQNDANAQLALGVIFAIGDGVERDYGQAYVWFDLAASQGHKDAEELRDLVARELGATARKAALREARELQAKLAG